jgi:hypothetical protein
MSLAARRPPAYTGVGGVCCGGGVADFLITNGTTMTDLRDQPRCGLQVQVRASQTTPIVLAEKNRT